MSVNTVTMSHYQTLHKMSKESATFKKALKIYPKKIYSNKIYFPYIRAFKIYTNKKVTNNFSSKNEQLRETRQGWVSEKKSEREQPSAKQRETQT